MSKTQDFNNVVDQVMDNQANADNKNRDFREAVTSVIKLHYEIADNKLQASEKARRIMTSNFGMDHCIAASVFTGLDVKVFMGFSSDFRDTLVTAFVNPEPNQTVDQMIEKAHNNIVPLKKDW